MKQAILLPLLAGCVTYSWAALSLAEPKVEPQSTERSDSDQARLLFNQARQLSAQALYEQACPKFEESVKLDPRFSTQFNLADCWEHLGRTASAHALFLQVADATQRTGDKDREQIARRRAEMLEPRLCAIEVNVPHTAPGLTIQRGATELAVADFGSPVAIDPGTLEIRAEAPGKKTWSTRVEVEPCPTLVTVEIPELEAALAPKAPVEPAASVPPPPTEPEPAQTEPAPTEPAPTEPVAKSEERSLVLPLSLGGLGVGGIISGMIFAGQYKGDNNKAHSICKNSTVCSASDIQQHNRYVDDAKTDRTWAYVGFGVGTAALAGAAILYFTGESTTESTAEKGWSAAPFIVDASNAWGASVQRSF